MSSSDGFLPTLDCEQRYQLLAQHTRECVWLYDVSGQRLIYVSPSFIHLGGLRSEKALGLKLPRLFTDASYKRLKAIIRSFGPQRSVSPPPPILTRLTYQHADGRTTPTQTTLQPIIHGSPGRLHILCVSNDVSNQRALEQKFHHQLHLRDQMIRRLQLSAKRLNALVNKQLQKNRELSSMAIRDELTGLFNRHHFNQQALAEMSRSDRYDTPLSMILFDLDHFKHVNDTYGHAVGDQVLKGVAQTIAPLVREPDILARWGGEEFAILMPQTDLPGAFLLAERLRTKLEKLTHKQAGQVTASFGLAQRSPREGFNIWYTRVDETLYMAKQRGRNRTAAADPSAGRPYFTLQWQREWESGNQEIDQQHRNIFTICNHIIALLKSKDDAHSILALLSMLNQAIIQHLPTEEALQQQINFPDRELHAMEHRKLVEKLAVLERGCAQGALSPRAFFSFLFDEVVLNHILTKDSTYFSYIGDANLN